MQARASFRSTLLAAAVAAAMDAAAQEPAFRFEITPYASYRVGGEFEPQPEPKDANGAPLRAFELHEGDAEGLIFDIRTSEGNGQWEVLYAHQSTQLDTQPSFVAGPTLDVDVSHLQFGGALLFDIDSDSVAPFLALAAGVARFDPSLDSAGAESYLSWSLGGGVQLRKDRRIGVRLEARVLSTLIDDDSALFCVSAPPAASCAVIVEGDQLYQLEARVGVVARF